MAARADNRRSRAHRRSTGVLLVSDEVYEHFVSNGVHTARSCAHRSAARSVVVSSFGQTFIRPGGKSDMRVSPLRYRRDSQGASVHGVSRSTPRAIRVRKHLGIGGPTSICRASIRRSAVCSFRDSRRHRFAHLRRGHLLRAQPSTRRCRSQRGPSLQKKLIADYGVASIPYHCSTSVTRHRVVRFSLRQ